MIRNIGLNGERSASRSIAEAATSSATPCNTSRRPTKSCANRNSRYHAAGWPSPRKFLSISKMLSPWRANVRARISSRQKTCCDATRTTIASQAANSTNRKARRRDDFVDSYMRSVTFNKSTPNPNAGQALLTMSDLTVPHSSAFRNLSVADLLGEMARDQMPFEQAQ